MGNKAQEVLTAIKKFFDEGADCVYAGALLFDDDRTLQQHVEEAVEEFETPKAEMTEVKHKKRKIGKNFYGNWVGFEGKRKVRDFGKQEEQAQQWLWGV